MVYSLFTIGMSPIASRSHDRSGFFILFMTIRNRSHYCMASSRRIPADRQKNPPIQSAITVFRPKQDRHQVYYSAESLIPATLESLPQHHAQDLRTSRRHITPSFPVPFSLAPLDATRHNHPYPAGIVISICDKWLPAQQSCPESLGQFQHTEIQNYPAIPP